MNLHKESMLEAFKDAKGSRGVAGGPFVGGGGGASGGGSGGSLGASVSEGGGGGRGVALAIVAIAVAFVLGVFVGRKTAPGEVLAGGGDAGVEEEPPGLFSLGDLEDDSPSPWIEPDDAGEPAEEGVGGLFDPRNKYTLVAMAFTPSNEALAFDNYDHLIAKGMPAFPPFPTQNGMLVVVVGAAPKESDLASTLSRLQRLSGPNGSGRPYEGAYANPIRKLLPND